MSAPKKGKDLSALKARLAKKAASGEGPDDAPAPPAADAADAGFEAQPAIDVPPPGEVRAAAIDIPPPGEPSRPPMADIPAPGEVRKPVDIPPPGQVSQPVAAQPAAAPSKREDFASDPFSGGGAFDPNAGVIEDVGGDIKPRGGFGLPLFAGLIGIVVGVGLGWMGHKATDSKSRVEAARTKAEAISKKITEIEERRAKIALKIGEVQEALNAKDGDKATAALEEIGGEPIDISELFGWQLSTMAPEAVQAFHRLAAGYTALQFQTDLVKALVVTKKDVLSGKISGPTNFVAIRTPDGGQAVLAEYVAAVCDEIPEPAEGAEPTNPETLKKCEEGKSGEATGFLVRTDIGGEVGLVKADQANVIVPNGIYTFAIGTNPDQILKDELALRVSNIQAVADDLKKSSDRAAEGAAKLSEDPNVDGSGG